MKIFLDQFMKYNFKNCRNKHNDLNKLILNTLNSLILNNNTAYCN